MIFNQAPGPLSQAPSWNPHRSNGGLSIHSANGPGDSLSIESFIEEGKDHLHVES